MTEEQLETHTIAAWKEGKLKQRRALDNNEGSNPPCFVHVSVPDGCDKVFMYLSCSANFIVCKLFYQCPFMYLSIVLYQQLSI